jgi:Co/Zn/Cd efflux system component
VQALRHAVETDSRLRVVDLHLWTIGPGYRAAIVSVEATAGCQREDVEKLIPRDLGITHLTVEVRSVLGRTEE